MSFYIIAYEYTNNYTYLGQTISFENSNEQEIQIRIGNGWKKYLSLKDYVKGDYPLCLKRKHFDPCITPVLTYGAQTWSLTKRNEDRIIVAQRAMERSMLASLSKIKYEMRR